MKKFLFGFLGGVVFAGLVALLIVLGFLAAFTVGDNRPTVTDNSVLVLDLEGSVPERAAVDVPIPFLGQEAGPTVLDTWLLLRKGASDPRIKALVVAPRGLSVGWAKLEELRAQIIEFKKSGKPVYASLRAAGTPEYYLATAADQIYMPPDDWLDVKGLRAELTFLKDADKLGVSMEFEGVGLYKDAPDTYTKTSPSPQTLEVTNEILDQFYGDLVKVIAEGRKRQPEQARAAIDQGPFVGQGAVDNGMIDGLLFEDQVYDRLNGQVKAGTLNKVRARDYAKVPVTGFEGPSRIAVIAGDGEILGVGGAQNAFSAAGMTGPGMAKVLKQVADDDSIKGVVLRVDSPGGDAIASAEILHAAQLLSAKKPLIISMSDYAASGGYMMSMTGDPVLAYSNTLTGSIGVFFGKLTLKGLYDKIGLNKYLLKRGRWATIDSEYTPLSADERTRLQQELKIYYRGFVQRVADGRKKDYNVVEPLAQGRVWLGAQAIQNGLIDEIGGLDRAVAMIKEKAKIPVADKITLVPYPQKRTLLQVLMDRDQPATEIDAAIEKVMGGMPWRSLAKGGVLQTLPYAVKIQ